MYLVTGYDVTEALAEIREIGERSGLEIEVFAQGALCYSISGRCLMSIIRIVGDGRVEMSRLPFVSTRTV